ncbi:hypothetical protein EYW49_10560 [Siculibacillus lacustris]|uniref:Iron transporter n=1 Tax=Siculibacillus lacustris TaxID=1549641 RepID=A0A4V6MZ30_9HYPH|nr:iron transporter [Siculibacillus lacustris]TBW38035.1 hypothetical protein EYW49_10560 [Siculibacillus lacustris]
MHSTSARIGLATALFAAATLGAAAKEYPIGKPQSVAGMEIGAVYLQPIEMDPPGMMKPAADSDVHLEADIHAAKGNKSGFAEGDWMPYLAIKFELVKLDDNTKIAGDFMPMVASDGPHYGDNVKMAGPGKYRLTYTISPPNSTHGNHFGRHIDKETGVGKWFDTFTVSYEFTYAGIGKKGAY